MKYLFCGFILLGAVAYLIDFKGVGQDFRSVANASEIQSPVVVELYTSQSCSSCPSADKVLSEMAENENIITLGCHVTYWNHLHWKDTLSMPECTNRQRAFNNAKNTGRVYTPQMVINGEVEFVGSRRGQAIKQIENAKPILPISMKKDSFDIVAHVPNASYQDSLFIEWIGLYKNHTQSIASGENGGRELNYTTPVGYIAYDQFDATHTNFQKPLSDFKKYDRVVVLIREKIAGKIVAAGKIDL